MVHRVALDPRVEDFCPQDHEGRWHIVLLWIDETNIGDTNVARGHFTPCRFGVVKRMQVPLKSWRLGSHRVAWNRLRDAGYKQKSPTKETKTRCFFGVVDRLNLYTELHRRDSHSVALHGWCGGEGRLGEW